MADKTPIHPITVDLPVDVWEKLSKLAAADGRKTAWMARKIVSDYVNQNNGKDVIQGFVVNERFGEIQTPTVNDYPIEIKRRSVSERWR